MIKAPLESQRLYFKKYERLFGLPGYEVRLADGTLIGSVERDEEESWRTMPSGVRYGFRGMHRYWRAILPGGGYVGYRWDTRKGAANRLIEEHNGK